VATVAIHITRFNNKDFTVLPNYTSMIFKKGKYVKNIFNNFFFLMKMQRVYYEVGKKFNI